LTSQPRTQEESSLSYYSKKQKQRRRTSLPQGGMSHKSSL
ncbi:hypothetical protein LINGRAHAP2_LOCUS29064, partial [Linum grandiflorum]